jgi:hypothetical protein
LVGRWPDFCQHLLQYKMEKRKVGETEQQG